MKNTKIIVLVVLVVLVVFPKKVTAADLSLGIYPPIIQIRLDPPASISSPISIENLGDQAVTLQILLKPFAASESENGEVAYLWNNKQTEADSIKVTENGRSLDEITLAPKQKKTLSLDLNIAKDESESDYYFSILFISKNSTSADLSHSQIRGGVATNVLLSIGTEKPIANILEFSAPFLLESRSVPFTIRIQNEGKHFITAKADILIKNILGQTVHKVELPAINVLAERSRLQKYIWQKSPFFGPYTATLTINLSENSALLIKATNFFIFPIKLIIGLSIILPIVFVVRKI